MKKVKSRMEFVVLGRVVGTSTGWDQASDFGINLYDFEPAVGCKIPAGVPFIDYAEGTVETFDEFGKVVTSTDLVEAIGSLAPKRERAGFGSLQPTET